MLEIELLKLGLKSHIQKAFPVRITDKICDAHPRNSQTTPVARHTNSICETEDSMNHKLNENELRMKPNERHKLELHMIMW